MAEHIYSLGAKFQTTVSFLVCLTQKLVEVFMLIREISPEHC